MKDLGKTELSHKTADQAHQIIDEQRNAVELAKKSFEEIIVATNDVIARIIFMNQLITNIDRNKNYTLKAIENISAISEETAASAEEVSGSSEEQTALAEQVKFMPQELSEKAENLTASISQFKI